MAIFSVLELVDLAMTDIVKHIRQRRLSASWIPANISPALAIILGAV